MVECADLILEALKQPFIWGLLLGLLQAQWTYTGYDASAHVAEETVGARVSSAWMIPPRARWRA